MFNKQAEFYNDNKETISMDNAECNKQSKTEMYAFCFLARDWVLCMHLELRRQIIIFVYQNIYFTKW